MSCEFIPRSPTQSEIDYDFARWITGVRNPVLTQVVGGFSRDWFVIERLHGNDPSPESWSDKIEEDIWIAKICGNFTPDA